MLNNKKSKIMGGSDFVAIKKCCALCKKYDDSKKCPLYYLYSDRDANGVNAFDVKHKYNVYCIDFELNGQYNL